MQKQKFNISFEIGERPVTREEVHDNLIRLVCSSPLFLEMVKKELDKIDVEKSQGRKGL